jgi:hypothetical protein
VRLCCWASGSCDHKFVFGIESWHTTRTERLKIARWSILAKEPACRVERSMARFLGSWYNFSELYECRGTSLIGASKLSRYRIFVGGTGPPAGGSRYNLSRSQNPDSYRDVTVQDLNCWQVCVSGCKFQQDLSWE